MACDLPEQAWKQLILPGPLGGCGVRKPGLCPEAAAHLSEDSARELSTKLQETWGIQTPTGPRPAALAAATRSLAEKGVQLTTHGCSFTDETKSRIARTPWETPEGKRRQPTLSAAIAHAELYDACGLWEEADERQRNRLRGGSGPGVGKVWTCQPATRSTTFGDQHWRQMLVTKLGLDAVRPGARCQLKRADGHPCNEVLDSQCNHSDGCKHGAAAMRVHGAVQQSLAKCLQTAGAFVDKERFVAALTTEEAPEAILDVVAHWPASPQTFAIDVTVRNPSAARYQGMVDIAAQAEAEKCRRYGPEAVPLAMWTDGRIGPRSLLGIRALAAEARHAKLQDTSQFSMEADWRLQIEAALLWTRADNVLRAAGRALLRPRHRAGDTDTRQPCPAAPPQRGGDDVSPGAAADAAPG